MASIYDNWMRDLDNDPAESQEQAALLSYLNSTTTADEAAHQYIKKVTESENFPAELTWSLLIEAAEEFPQAHQKLVELLDIFARFPWTEKGMARKSGGNLTDFVFELRDAFDGIESASQSSHSTITDERHYINFALSSRAFGITSTENGAIGPCNYRTMPWRTITAVAQLFLLSGPEMYASSNARELSEYSAGPLLQKERETATVSRWEFWKRRLAQLKESELLSVETGALFSKVLESMAKVEAENGG